MKPAIKIKPAKEIHPMADQGLRLLAEMYHDWKDREESAAQAIVNPGGQDGETQKASLRKSGSTDKKTRRFRVRVSAG